MFKHLKFSLGVMIGAWLSAMFSCAVMWSPDIATTLGPWWLFAMVVVSTTVVMSGLSSLLLSLAMHRFLMPRRYFLNGTIAGLIAIPICLFAGLTSDAPFSGFFLAHVCIITAIICLVTTLIGVSMASRIPMLSSTAPH